MFHFFRKSSKPKIPASIPLRTVTGAASSKLPEPEMEHELQEMISYKLLRPPTGLANYGRNCYANVFFQCLNSLSAMEHFRLAPLPVQAELCSDEDRSRQLTCCFLRRVQRTLRAMDDPYQERPLPLSAIPSRTLEAIGAMMGVADWNSQQDVSELLQCFFEALSEEAPEVYLSFSVRGSGSCPGERGEPVPWPSWCLTVPFPDDAHRLDLGAQLASARLVPLPSGQGENGSGRVKCSCGDQGGLSVHLYSEPQQQQLPPVLIVSVPRLDAQYRHRMDVQLQLGASSGGLYQPVAGQALYRLVAAIAYWGVDGTGGMDEMGIGFGGDDHLGTKKDYIAADHAPSSKGEAGGPGVWRRLGQRLSTTLTNSRVGKVGGARDTRSRSQLLRATAALDASASPKTATAIGADSNQSSQQLLRQLLSLPPRNAPVARSKPIAIVDGEESSQEMKPVRPKQQKVLRMMARGLKEEKEQEEEEQNVIDEDHWQFAEDGYEGEVEFRSLADPRLYFGLNEDDEDGDSFLTNNSTRGQAGHYAAYVSRGNRWYFVSDKFVKQVKIVVTDNITVLFYERV